MLSVESLYESLALAAADQADKGTSLITRAEQLSRPQEAVSPELTSEDLRLKFSELGVPSIAVVDGGKPVGMVNRNTFMDRYARPFARELYGSKSCVSFMDEAPLVMDANMPVEVLVRAAVASGGKVLSDGFITIKNGVYQGVGTGFDLMKAMSDIEAEKTRQLMSSINYASLIQRSHLVESDNVLQTDFEDYGLVWLPRDVVGGDAYFFRKVGDGVFGCVFDCTGHGVPGAFMTLIVLSYLEQKIKAEATGIDPGEVIASLNAYLKRVLRQEDRPFSDAGSAEKASNDGLDAAMFVLSYDQKSLRIASAKLSLLVARSDGSDIQQIEGENKAVGYSDTSITSTWPTHQIDLGPNCLLVIPTDGVIDQIGEVKRIAHGKKRVVNFMKQHREDAAPLLVKKFNQHFNDWQGSEKRRDDVTLLAFRTVS